MKTHILSRMFLVISMILTVCNNTDSMIKSETDIVVETEASENSWQKQYHLGMRYLLGGQCQEAVIAFTAAIEIDPKQALAYVGRANSYVKRGQAEVDLELAKADYKEAIKLDETLIKVWLRLIDVLIRSEDFDEALIEAERGYEITGDEDILNKLEELQSGTVRDSKGRARRTSYYDGDGELAYYHTFTYSEKERLERIKVFNKNDKMISYGDPLYDNQGREIRCFTVGREENSVFGGFLNQRDIEYDENGNRNKITFYGRDMSITGSITYEYDDKNRVVRGNSFDQNGELEGYDIQEYNEKGERVESRQYDKNGQLVNFNIFEYDN